MQLTRFTASGLILLVFMLTACSQRSPHQATGLAGSTLKQPENSLADFQQVSCEHIWSYAEDTALNNPLYWQRSVDCALHLTPEEARAEAQEWPADNWQSAFRQAILLSQSRVTAAERRQYLQQLDSYEDDFPAPMHPLLILWREGQGALLQLSAERARYLALQQSSDAQLNALQQQQAELQKDLAATRRKLDSLTDIERQLSARRAPDAAENNGHDSNATGNTSPDEATR